MSLKKKSQQAPINKLKRAIRRAKVDFALDEPLRLRMKSILTLM